MSTTTRSRPSRKTMNEVPEWVDVVVKEWVSAHGESFVDYEVSLIYDRYYLYKRRTKSGDPRVYIGSIKEDGIHTKMERKQKEDDHSRVTIMDMLEKASAENGRMRRGIRHPMKENLFIILIGYLLGCKSLREIIRTLSPDDPVEYNENKKALSTFMPLPFGIPDSVIAFADYLLSFVSNDNTKHIDIDTDAVRTLINKGKDGRNYNFINMFEAAYYLFMYRVDAGSKNMEEKKVEEEIAAIISGNSPLVSANTAETKNAILEIIVGKKVNLVKANKMKLMDTILDVFRREIKEANM